MRSNAIRRSRFSRMFEILVALQSGHSYTPEDLMKMLKTSRRTLFRDLKTLKKARVNWFYDRKNNCYKLDGHCFLPAPALNNQEAFALLFMAYEGQKHLEYPFSNSVLKAAMKIETNLSPITKYFCKDGLKNVSVKATPHNGTSQLDRIFAQLQHASVRHRVLTVRYYGGERKIEETELSPYHLMHNKHVWYVFGHSSLHKQIQAFNISSIRSLNKSDAKFVERDGFNIQKHLGKAWSMLPEGKVYDIRLKFSNRIAQEVCKVTWHKSQKIERQNDGSAIVSFEVDGLGEITPWILGYGDDVEVLEPKALRRKVARVAEKIVKKNGSRAPARREATAKAAR